MRDDSILYGRTHTMKRQEEAKEKQRARRLESQSARAELLPIGDTVIKELQIEREKTEKALLKLIGAGTPKEEVKDVISSLNMYDDSMSKLIGRFKNLLRDNKVKND